MLMLAFIRNHRKEHISGMLSHSAINVMIASFRYNNTMVWKIISFFFNACTFQIYRYVPFSKLHIQLKSNQVLAQHTL